MNKNVLALASGLSNADLLARLLFLAEHTREDGVELIAHLAEMEARRLYLEEGYGSLFDYCRIALRLSEHEAYSRQVAARVARQFPAILEGLADGSVNLTTIRLLAPHLSPDNHRDVLGRAAGQSKRGVEALIASLAPRPDVAPSIRRMPVANQGVEFEAEARKSTPVEARTGQLIPSVATPIPPAPGAPAPSVPAAPTLGTPPSLPRPIVAPLSPTRYRLQCTIGEEAHTNLRLAQDLLRREIPSGDPGAIVERALALLLAHVAKEKTAATATPGPARPMVSGSRHIPAAVKRAVWLRDRGQCAFVAEVGRRCTQRAFLEFHHLEPFAVGGEPTVTNISLRCRRHNVHEAELVFGDQVRAAGSRVSRETQNAGHWKSSRAEREGGRAN